jgi:gag-polypeptide of LTR copia-type
MADRGNDDRAVLPLPVFNGTINGPSKKGNDGYSYAVWSARFVNNLRAKRLLSIVTGNDDDDYSDDDDIQPSVQRRQARAAHIMTSALGTGPFLFVQGVNNDPAAIHRILDTKCQGTDTLSVMSAVNEFTTKTYHAGQHIEMFVTEFEGLAMRLEAIGHRVSEQMRVVNFLNSLSEVPALSAVSALCVIDNLRWTKATTQILLESELKSAKNNGQERPDRAMVANNEFTGICYTCGEVCHRSSDHIDRGCHQSRHPMRRYGGHGGGNHADSRQGDHHADHRQGHGGASLGGAHQGGARQGGASQGEAGHEGD